MAEEIKAKVPKLGDREVSINYDFGKDIDEAIAKFGKDAVFSNFKANAVITIQGGARTMAVKGKTDQEIQAHYDTYKIGAAAPRTAADPVASLISKFPTLDAAKQDELLKKLKELKEAKKAK
jgi:hypothetical protein